MASFGTKFSRVIVFKFLIALSIFYHSLVAFRPLLHTKFKNHPTEITHGKIRSSILQEVSSEGNFAESFVAQKNFILLDKLQAASNMTEVAEQFVNFCDESFSVFLNDKIANAASSEEENSLGKVRYEINCARQRKLKNADLVFRDILSAGGLKQMEAKLSMYLRKAEIDMAFMVILQLNIEDATAQNVTTAVQIMTHLETLIHEHQDSTVSPTVRLMRLLVRTDDSYVRKQMLRQKLILGDPQVSDPEISVEPQSTLSPQCEHIIVAPVRQWGGAEVSVQELEDTIEDVMAQVSIYIKYTLFSSLLFFHFVLFQDKFYNRNP